MNKSLVIFLMFLIFYGCDIFNVRPSEPPDAKTNIHYKAFTPEELLQNLQDAVNKKNYDIYISCFDKNLEFQYYPLAQSVISYPVLNSWNYTKEINYFRNLFNNKSTSLIISSKLELKSNIISRNIDSSLVNCDYKLKLIKNNNDTLDADGSFSLILKQNNSNYWIIKSWKEIRKNSEISWSDIRGMFTFE